MKIVYIKPALDITELELVTMLAASSIEVKPGESGEEQLSNRRRGQWGNLWADEK